ncbi:hypothetical protein [Massilia sp. X63]|uniref:hypothetical protein n=1 Tax=Massilia sp. X63 TaxID=3237285 RepID=UPI0034DD9EDD
MSTELNQKHEAVLRKASAAIRARGHEGDARLADSVDGIISSLSRRASPAAAVPEGALPPLPILPDTLLEWISDYGLARTEGVGEVDRLHIWEMLIKGVKQYATDYARAAVEADRARLLPTTGTAIAMSLGPSIGQALAEKDRVIAELREQFDAAFLSWNGFHTKAELDAEWAPGTLAGEMFRAGAENRADRAQQHQSGHMPPFAAPASQRKAIISAIGRAWQAVAPGISPMGDKLKHAIAREVSIVLASRCRAPGGDGAPSAGDVSADRAQQGEPVAMEQSYSYRTRPLDVVGRVNGEWSEWKECTREQYIKGIPHAWPRDIEFRAATKAASPADAPTMESLVDALRNAALDLLELKGDASAKLEIAGEPPLYVLVGHADGIAKLLPGATPVPDTGIPTAGEDEQELEFLKYWLSFAAEPVGMTCCGQPCVGAEYMGQVEMVCCGNGEPEFRSDKDVIDAMEVRHNELSAKLFAAGSARQGGNTKPESNDNFRAPVSSTPTSGEVEKAGWKWVPVEPTDEMREACRVLNYCDDIDAEWARMLAAAPSYPSEAQTCTCPSGDGSLRWPCPAHPLEAKAGEAQQ